MIAPIAASLPFLPVRPSPNLPELLVNSLKGFLSAPDLGIDVSNQPFVSPRPHILDSLQRRSFDLVGCVESRSSLGSNFLQIFPQFRNFFFHDALVLRA
jgi:hypothetical protein